MSEDYIKKLTKHKNDCEELFELVEELELTLSEVKEFVDGNSINDNLCFNDIVNDLSKRINKFNDDVKFSLKQYTS